MRSVSILRGVLPRLFGLWLAFVVSAGHASEDTIKIGILHSLSGTMAISESVLKDTVLMMIEDQNKKGGLLGRKLEPVILDPASDPDMFAKEARELLSEKKVAVVFGCWTSASRKAVLPIFEQLNSLLFCPVDVDPRTTNRNLSAYLAEKGVSPDDIMAIYTPFGYSQWRGIVDRIKAFGSEGKKTAVISTINGDANTYFYMELAAQHMDAHEIQDMP